MLTTLWRLKTTLRDALLAAHPRSAGLDVII